MPCSTVLPPGCLQPVVLDLSTRTPVVVPDCGAPAVLPPESQVVVVTQALQGLPGPPGPASGQVLQRTAGQDMSALLAVYEDMFGDVWPADAAVEADVLALLGVTVSAAPGGQAVNVQRLGVIDDSGWSWVPGQRVYLAGQGRLTQDPPVSGYDVLIGMALSQTRLLLNLQDPIELE